MSKGGLFGRWQTVLHCLVILALAIGAGWISLRQPGVARFVHKLHFGKRPHWDNPWGKVLTSSGGHEGPIGSYGLGCLDGAHELAPDGKGWQVMRPSRHRGFGHATLLAFIEKLGAVVTRQKIGPLLVGDMGLPRGGPMPTGHASHQIGLDVDIWYWLNPDAAQRSLTRQERETLSAVNMVNAETRTVQHWSPENARILELAARPTEVDRIFVNPVIKRELCRTVPEGHRDWLRKLRPWWGHDDHFHVRLQCPAGAPNCRGQAPIAAGDGCGKELDWWFTPEAKEPPHPETEEDTGLGPPLPALCAEVLKELG